MVQETILVDSVGPGGREMIPTVVEQKDPPADYAEVSVAPKKTRKKKTSE